MRRLLLLRALQCRHIETVGVWDCTGLCLALDGSHELKRRVVRCERRLHFGDDHR
jgi:hypothetical protein